MMTKFLSFTAKRQDEDYDEQVEETLQDEVSAFHLRSLNCCEDLNSLDKYQKHLYLFILNRMKTMCTS